MRSSPVLNQVLRRREEGATHEIKGPRPVLLVFIVKHDEHALGSVVKDHQ